MIKTVRNILLLILSTEILWSIFFPEWEFSNYYLRIAEAAVLPFVFFAFLAWVAAILGKSIYSFLIVGLYSLPVALFFSWFALHPLDSHSDEKDIAVVKQIGENKENNRAKIFQLQTQCLANRYG